MSNVTPLRRTAIIVRDMERSLQFYREVLGLKVWREGMHGPDDVTLTHLLGAPPCTLRYAILQADDVEWGMVGLFEMTDPAPADDTHPAIDRANRGEACLVFHTPDVRAIHRAAVAMGISVFCPPTRVVLKEHGLESLEMMLRDPSGVLLNFIQNVKGGLAPHNRFPGIAGGPARRPDGGAGKRPRAGRAAAAPARRSAKTPRSAKASQPAKPRKSPGPSGPAARRGPAANASLRRRSGASRRRRPG
ncbi:MAG: VOC family protein [Steroidobacteraceae bacterium]|nr:VOC family protein [Steroidobacteraceae bacterium]